MADELDTNAAPRKAPKPLTVLYLDVDDEITSAAARIRNAGADDVALVLPFGSRLATSRINFRLLAREARERGKKIEVISGDSSARALALAAGLAVHPSVASFEGRTAAGGGQGSATDGPGDGDGSTAGGAGAEAREGVGTGARAAAGIAGAAPASRTDPPRARSEADDAQTRVLAVPRRAPPNVPRVGPPRPPVRTGVAVGVLLALMVAILAGGLLALEYLPTATITLHPRSAPVGPVALEVQAREDVTEPDPATLAIPAQRFTFTLEVSDTFPATGTRVIEAKATGRVTFSNFDNGRGVVVPAGTIVRTDGNVEFATLAEITLPRAQQDFFPPFSTRPSVASVDVQAVLAGPDGNVGNNTIVDIPEAGRNLIVNNDQATSGGARDERPRVSPEDVAAATAAVEAALVAELDGQIAERTGVPAAVTLFPATRVLGEAEYSADPATIVGTEATEFTLGATAEGSALGVDPAPLAALARGQLADRVTPGWTIVPDSMSPDVGSPVVVGNVISYPVSVTGTQVRDVDERALVGQIAGLIVPEARARLDDYGDVEIEVWPDWVTTIPTRAERITITVGDPQPAATPSP